MIAGQAQRVVGVGLADGGTFLVAHLAANAVRYGAGLSGRGCGPGTGCCAARSRTPGSAPYCRVAGQTLKGYKLGKEFLNHVDICEQNPRRSTP